MIFLMASILNWSRGWKRVCFILWIFWEVLLLCWDREGEKHFQKIWQEVATPTFLLLFWRPLPIFLDFHSGKRRKMRNCLKECLLGCLPSENWKIAEAEERKYSINSDPTCVEQNISRELIFPVSWPRKLYLVWCSKKWPMEKPLTQSAVAQPVVLSHRVLSDTSVRSCRKKACKRQRWWAYS